MKKAVLNGMERLGLRPRQFKKRHLVPRGYGEWQSQIFDEEEFRRAVRGGLERLREAEGAVELGDYLEFGVSRGTSLACVHGVLNELGLGRMRLVGFDSFQGLPPEAGGEEGWQPGEYASTERATRRYLAQHGVDLKRVALVKGWFRDTLNAETRRRLGLAKASLIMLDCDLYSATKEALAFCVPLVRDRAVVIFDDWGWRSDRDEVGQREAFEECVEATGLFTAEALPGYIPQSRLFLLTRRAAGNGAAR